MFNRLQSTQDEKARFIKRNELKLTQVELFSFLFFKRVFFLCSILPTNNQNLGAKLKGEKNRRIFVSVSESPN